MRDRVVLPFLLPLLAVLAIVIYGGGLGVIFIVGGETTAIVIGSLIAIGVPAIGAYVVTRQKESGTRELDG